MQALSFAIVSREANMVSASPLQKWSQYTGTYCPQNGVYTLYSQWGIFHGGASGSLSTVLFTNWASSSSMATSSIGQTDTTHFKVFVGTLAAGSSGRAVQVCVAAVGFL